MRIALTVPDGVAGQWAIESFSVTNQEASDYNERWVINPARNMESGNYKRLMFNREVIMSNTPAEVSEHADFIKKAKGRVLIFGLGLGMVVTALIKKSEVMEIVVIELSSDVIQLSGKHYTDMSQKVRVIQHDALTYVDGTIYDYIWCDIWPAITSENLLEMDYLKRKWKSQARHYVGCWAEDQCIANLRQEIAIAMDSMLK